jgi:hypothetical protein
MGVPPQFTIIAPLIVKHYGAGLSLKPKRCFYLIRSIDEIAISNVCALRRADRKAIKMLLAPRRFTNCVRFNESTLKGIRHETANFMHLNALIFLLQEVVG